MMTWKKTKAVVMTNNSFRYPRVGLIVHVEGVVFPAGKHP